MKGAWAIVGYAFRESLRRRVVLVVCALTVAFLALYALGVHFAFQEVESSGLELGELFEERALVGGTLLGLAMFAVLFLGAVLVVFLTNGIVRGDAESGLLQPLVVRPMGRGATLVARYLGAAAAGVAYVLVVYLAAVLAMRALGDWAPENVLGPGLSLALAVAVIATLSVLASVQLATTAQGIAVFMLFGAGLVGGLLGQLGEALSSRTLERIGEVVSMALPFEALYQYGLHLLTEGTSGLTEVVIRLGPFGGAEDRGAWLVIYALAYAALVLAVAVAAFRRRDL